MSAASTGSVKRLEITVNGHHGDPCPGAGRPRRSGQTLELVVTSDHDDELHAHGFDVEAHAQGRRARPTLRLTGRSPASTRSRPTTPP